MTLHAPRLHKAIFHVRANEDLKHELLSALRERAREWARQQGRIGHWINAYINDGDEDAGSLVVVVTNRDTALLMKLALG